ncbi:hypothetical protein CWN83_24475 [Vibrio splendidus]|nr:hypothetical protein CWN83_24475 [Vibrio splendidus]
MAQAIPDTAKLDVNFKLPKIDTSMYARPYVAVWVENSERKSVKTIELWVGKDEWLKDLRSWWRKVGRYDRELVDAVTFELPKIDTSMYARPYVAVWVENSERKSVKTIELWVGKDEWLKDLRSWWRKVGRYDRELVDAVTSATRPAGQYRFVWNGKSDDGQTLEQGEYTVHIEVVREHGGRNYLRQKVSLTDVNWVGKDEWLKDLRSWWRKVGRYDRELVDAVTSATRPAGQYRFVWDGKSDDGQTLEQGEYTVHIEVVREHGGRNYLRQKVSLTDVNASYELKATEETGEITLNYIAK